MDFEELKKAIAEGMKDIGEKVKGMISDAITPIKTSVDELKGRVEKIEKLPATQASFNINTIPQKYKGYNLDEQGKALGDIAAKSPRRFPIFSNEQKFADYKKFMINVIQALAFKDVNAMMELAQHKTAMSEGTSNVGGYLVAPEYEMELIELAREASFALNLCTVIPMSSNQLYLPSEATMVSVAWKAEAAQGTASNPTFGQVSLTAKKLFGLTEYISNELLADSSIDIVSLLTKQFSYATLQELDNQVLNGTGDPVSGVLTAACGYSVVLGTGSTSFSAVSADNFRNLMRKLAAVDAANARFIYSKDIQYYVDTLKDTQGRYIYREPSGERPAALWGRPVFESAKGPLEAASAVSTAFAAFGRWEYFYIGQRKGQMTIDIDPYGKFDYDQTRLRMITRWALAMARSTAFARLVTAAS